MSNDQKPVAWSYELATTMLEHGYDGWTHRITRHKPNVPEGSIRNLTPLYTATPQRKPLTEGVLMGVYIDFDRAADPAWSKVEYLLQFARAIERALEEKNRGR